MFDRLTPHLMITILGIFIVVLSALIPDLVRLIRKNRYRRYALGSQLKPVTLGIQSFIVMIRSNLEIFIFSLLGIGCGVAILVSDPVMNWDPSIQIVITILCILIGVRLPRMREEQRLKARKKMIEQDLPYIIDLLIVVMESGISFETALKRLLDDRHFDDRPITQDLASFAKELDLTPDRHAAFRKFWQASSNDYIRLFASTLLQSENYGIPVSSGLRNLAFDLRQKQFSRLEERSGALGPKLTIPMTLFFLPVIFIIVLAPTLIRILKLS